VVTYSVTWDRAVSPENLISICLPKSYNILGGASRLKVPVSYVFIVEDTKNDALKFVVSTKTRQLEVSIPHKYDVCSEPFLKSDQIAFIAIDTKSNMSELFLYDEINNLIVPSQLGTPFHLAGGLDPLQNTLAGNAAPFYFFRSPWMYNESGLDRIGSLVFCGMRENVYPVPKLKSCWYVGTRIGYVDSNGKRMSVWIPEKDGPDDCTLSFGRAGGESLVVTVKRRQNTFDVMKVAKSSETIIATWIARKVVYLPDMARY